jgi:glycosyltransferase involved in cell wall biosynthesis
VRQVTFAVPGDLATHTGGYGYDRRMIVELQRLGWHIDILGLGDGFPWPSSQTRAAAQTLLMSVRRNDPIVIDGLAFGVLPDVGLKLRSHHPLVALIHHPLAFESGLFPEQIAVLRESERAALSCAIRVVVTSKTTARYLVADYAVPTERIIVVQPGTDPAPSARGSSGGVVQLLSIGSVVPRKGFDVLIAALATLTDLPWRLTIAGDRDRDPKTAAQLDENIARFNLNDRIAVIGAVPSADLAELYDRADLFVLASRFEGYGMAYTEAIAHGLPLIATTAGAIPDTVPAGTCVLVAPDDSVALASALRRLIENPGDRRELAMGARRAAGQLPIWRDSAKIFAAVLGSVA